MSLKPCRECQREVSTGAESCPQCGVKTPTKAPPFISQRGVTIEATGKRYKAIQAAAVVLILVGVVALIAGGGSVAHVSFLVGIPFYIYGRAGGWWHHG